MTADIVERLRRRVDHRIDMEASHTKTLEWEAAAEIERLRAALREAERLKLMWRNLCDNEVGISEGLRAQLAEARAALGEDK